MTGDEMMAKAKTETEFAAAADYFDQIAAWMRDNGCENPREIPDAVIEALKAGAQ